MLPRPNWSPVADLDRDEPERSRDHQRHGFKIKSPKAPWSIRDKVAATHVLISDDAGNRRLQVDPSCKQLIRSLSNLEYRAGSSHPDPKSDHSHMADAFAYAALSICKGLLPWRLGQIGFRIY